MRYHCYLLISLLLTGCATTHPTPQRSTPACIAYQRMITAPLPPYQHEQLRQQCQRSVAKLTSS